jgi:hypothetical protein
VSGKVVPNQLAACHNAHNDCVKLKLSEYPVPDLRGLKVPFESIAFPPVVSISSNR